jgi:transposase
VLTLSPTVRIYLAPGATDMRKAFDGLAAATKSVIGEDPLSGHLFVFCNRRRDRIKILWWDRSGFCLFAKRLEKGTFRWPDLAPSRATRVEMTREELMLLLGGIDLRRAKRRRWLEHPEVRKEHALHFF